MPVADADRPLLQYGERRQRHRHEKKCQYGAPVACDKQGKRQQQRDLRLKNHHAEDKAGKKLLIAPDQPPGDRDGSEDEKGRLTEA